MKLELLYFDGCPNWETALERLNTAAARRGLVATPCVVSTSEQAGAVGFGGSPTVLIDGRDPFATGDEAFALACRLYQTPGGRSRFPTIEQLDAALDEGLASTGSASRT